MLGNEELSVTEKRMRLYIFWPWWDQIRNQ